MLKPTKNEMSANSSTTPEHVTVAQLGPAGPGVGVGVGTSVATGGVLQTVANCVGYGVAVALGREEGVGDGDGTGGGDVASTGGDGELMQCAMKKILGARAVGG